jgi:hypothetical protein
MSAADVLVLAYGSLTSGFGLHHLGPLRTRSATRVAFTNARRGFGKLSQRGDRFAMVLEPAPGDGPIGARILAAATPADGAVEGLALAIPPVALARLADREGYTSGALQRLGEDAARDGVPLAEHLWAVFAAAGHEVTAFRERLFRRIGYTSPHYVPQPVRLADGRCALTFLAPGAEGTGCDRIVAVRVRTGQTALLDLVEAWQRKPNRTQLAYAVACLLGGVHGIAVQDLLASLAHDGQLGEALRLAVATEQRQELARFLAATNLAAADYFAAFGPASHALARSGLDGFLRGCIGGADT